MQKLIIALVLAIVLTAPVLGQSFYDVDSVRTLQLVFAQSNWDFILDSLYAAGNDDRLLATLYIDGVQYDSVGVRYKGNSTYNPNQVKNPFNIKLNYVKKNQLIQGYGTFKLANGKMDPSFLREVLSYEIASNYMPACRANYCNVYVNGTLIGLYVNVQDIDKLYCRTFFSSGGNPLFKGEYDGFPNGQTVWGYFGEDSANYAQWYQIDSDTGWADLIDFLDTLNNFPSAIARVMNVDRHLWMLAFDLLLVNLDAPINMAHNFYLYEDDAQRFNSIIWDLNMSFGGFTQVVGGSGLNLTTMQQLTPYFNLTNSRYPMIKNVLSNSTYKKMYIAHMKTMMQETISSGWYETRGLHIRDVIAPHVAADPNGFYTYSIFYNNLYSTAGGGPNGAVGLVQLMSGRVSYLNSLGDFQVTAPAITNVTHTPTIPMTGQTVWLTAAVNNVSSVTLKYRDNPGEVFTAVTMLDDGSHHDGTAGDGVYGASMPAGVGDIHYYLWAENLSAGSFLPPRAEFEDSVIAVQVPTAVDIVINEFMADNDATVADQDGEYEDWIELYNPTAAAVTLRKCYLSDKLTTLNKWTIPDTSIPAYGYLTIWADQDTLQVGLHANFALSKSGEAVVLSDSTLAIVDSITFGAQVTDSSYGRCPNGSGAFVIQGASFAAANNCGTSCCVGTTGNVNMAGIVDLSDLSALVSYLTGGGYALVCEAEANVNSAGIVDLSDLSALVSYLTGGGYVLPNCP